MNKIQKTNWRVLAALALSLLAVNSVRAASINWGTATTISGESDVSTAGSLLYAYTLGGGPGGPDGNIAFLATTVNTVDFARFVVPFSTLAPVTVGNVSLAIDAASSFYSVNYIAGNFIAPISSLTLPYQLLLASGVTTSANAGVLTLTLGGLTLGQNYSLQLWSSDAGRLTDRLGGTTYTAGNNVTLDNNTTDAAGGVGQWVIGNFKADAATEVLTISSSISTDFLAINGFQLRAVPEPGTLALLGLGAVVIAGFSWNRRRVIRG